MSIDNAIAALKSEMGPQVSITQALRAQHGQNESYFDEMLPDAVVFPQSTDDVVRIVKACAAHGCPIVPWGTGTSLEGNALAVKGGISLDMSRMDKILAVHSSDLDAVVQPGVTREALNDYVRDQGLFFPVDPGANASLGGMAATRASGTTAVRYGTMRENVMALEVVLADGRVVRTGTRARKSASGYDLTRLMVGSEGTLGIITELTVRLQGVPEAISAATCAFPDIASAVNSVIATIQMGVPMARMEFVDDVSAAAMNSYFGTDHPVLPHLFMEFHGTEAAVAEQAEMVGEIAAEHGGQGFLWSSKAEERNRLWHMRHKAYYAQKSLKPGCFAVTTDICVPISELANVVTATRADIDEMGLVGPMLGHVGEGNYHSSLLVDRDDEDAMARAKEVAHRMAERALSVGGTVTGEHGVGMGKMRYMAAEHGDGWAVMAGLKRSLDPQNILNPGKVVEVN